MHGFTYTKNCSFLIPNSDLTGYPALLARSDRLNWEDSRTERASNKGTKDSGHNRRWLGSCHLVVSIPDSPQGRGLSTKTLWRELSGEETVGGESKNQKTAKAPTHSTNNPPTCMSQRHITWMSLPHKRTWDQVICSNGSPRCRIRKLNRDDAGYTWDGKGLINQWVLNYT